jgi:hypothetical protein
MTGRSESPTPDKIELIQVSEINTEQITCSRPTEPQLNVTVGPDHVGFWVPDHTPREELTDVMQDYTEDRGSPQTESVGPGKGVSPCNHSSQTQGDQVDETQLDNMSNGEQEHDEMNQDEWGQGASGKKKAKRKAKLLPTRQSARLKSHGGIPIEVLAAKRKQKQNDTTGNTSKNSFAILNDLDDELLMQTA